MQLNWRAVVTDLQHARIFEALEDPRWDWRSLGALARASGLPAEQVVRILNSYPSLVRRSTAPGPQGEELFTLQSRYFNRKNSLQKALDFLSAPSSSSSST
jgi:hypothetical protein